MHKVDSGHLKAYSSSSRSALLLSIAVSLIACSCVTTGIQNCGAMVSKFDILPTDSIVTLLYIDMCTFNLEDIVKRKKTNLPSVDLS